MGKKKPSATKKPEELEGNDDEYDYIRVPPDGGYGWVVLVACFVSISVLTESSHCSMDFL